MMGDAAIFKAIEVVARMFDEEERLIYEVRMQAIADVDSKIASALQAGEQQAQERIALNLLDVLDIDMVAQKTGLSLEQVQLLQRKKS